MKIYFECSGGFIGIGFSSIVDTTLLDRGEADKIINLVENVHFFDLPNKKIESTSGADYFTYRITIEIQDKKHSIEFTDLTMQPELRSLVDILMDKVRESNN